MALIIKQYDVVRVIGIKGEGAPVMPEYRLPRVGDIARVVEIYTNPPGYELECVSPDGGTEWLASFVADDVTLEYIKPAFPYRHPAGA